MSLRNYFPAIAIAIAIAIATHTLTAIRLSGSSSEPPFTLESLTWNDHVAIEDLVWEKTFLPISSIKRTGEWRIEVLTAGSGCILQSFEFQKRRGQWRRISD